MPEDLMTAGEFAKMETDTEFRRRIEQDHRSIRERQHELSNKIQAMQMAAAEKNMEITLSLNELKNSIKNQDGDQLRIIKMCESMNAAINGDGGKTPGMLEIIRDHDRVVKKIDKITWTMITGTISAFGLSLWHLLKK